MYTVFNELSVDQKLCDIEEKDKARETINIIVKLLLKLKQVDGFNGLISTYDIFDFKILPNYGIQNWLQDPLVERKNKIFFRMFCNQKCSFIDRNNYPLSEFVTKIGGIDYPGTGCLVASEQDESIISLQTKNLWLHETIEGNYNTLDGNNIFSQDKQLHNVSAESHLAKLKANSKNQMFSMISSGQDLWENKETLFPNLVFCESVKDQLYKDPQKFHIEQIVKKLLRMQEYFSEYNGIYDPQLLGLKARTESESVKSDPKLKAFRLFRKPDGTEEYFYDHIGFTGSYCGRIHFLPNDANRKCYIGYIGKHLPTEKY